jgi:hypothetical protein
MKLDTEFHQRLPFQSARFPLDETRGAPTKPSLTTDIGILLLPEDRPRDFLPISKKHKAGASAPAFRLTR